MFNKRSRWFDSTILRSTLFSKCLEYSQCPIRLICPHLTLEVSFENVSLQPTTFQFFMLLSLDKFSLDKFS